MSAKVTQPQAKLTLSNQNYSLRKYKLLQLIDSQPLYMAKNLQKNLPLLLGISRQAFSNYLNAPLGATLQIPSDKLLTLASLFNVQPSELLNEPVKTLKLDSFIPKSFSEASVKTGLTR